jgi:uracil-DNA glycosylase
MTDDESDRADMAMGPSPWVMYRGDRLLVRLGNNHTVYYGEHRSRWNLLEARYAKHKLGLTDDQVVDSALAPVGPILVGEAPGESTSRWLPMFPFPRSSAGGRLLTISSMTPFDYLRTFHRVNLFETLPKKWEAARARVQAVALLQRFQGHPLVLLGSKVCTAFNVTAAVGDWRPIQQHGCWLLLLPHPSGRNLLTNDDAVRRGMREALFTAVDLWRHPRGPVVRDACQTCGKLTQVHPTHPRDNQLHVMCPGETMRFCYALTERS